MDISLALGVKARYARCRCHAMAPSLGFRAQISTGNLKHVYRQTRFR